ncbi:MAG: hypothetical protein KatS3mg124_0226 [Porticoccaceae bacterium]|nr:MAG: hypothetical protein KatS3mg124_0226 [Porticoccaceae bacterium]
MNQTPSSRPSAAAFPARVEERLPEREYRPDEVQLFLYNAVLFNAHRIHFDHPYATLVEEYPGLVVPGPLMGDWLHQCVEEWLGARGRLVAIEYSNRKAAYVGERLTTGGRVIGVDAARRTAEVEVYVRNEVGEVIVPGKARVEFFR